MRKHISVKDMALVAIFTALVAIGAFIKIPIPYVPFTLQFLFTMLSGLLLGPKLGMLSVLIYMFMGLIGLPVFTEGGGPSYVLKPSFGYIVGFAVASYVTGYIVYSLPKLSFIKIFLANLVGLAIVYLFGMVHYYMISNYIISSPISLKNLIIYCFLLAVPGDIFLCALSASLSKRIIPVIQKGG